MAAKPFRLTRPEPTEAEVLRAVLHALKLHPRVEFAFRANSGVFRPQRKDGSLGFVRAGWKGCSDIIGMLKDGNFLAVEVKRPSGKATPEQEAFLAAVSKGGGTAFVARSVDDVMRAL